MKLLFFPFYLLYCMSFVMFNIKLSFSLYTIVVEFLCQICFNFLAKSYQQSNKMHKGNMEGYTPIEDNLNQGMHM